MADKAHEGQTSQNTTKKYLTKDNLQILLEDLFPGQTEFNIRVRNNVDQFLFDRCILCTVRSTRLILGADERGPMDFYGTKDRERCEFGDVSS